MLQGYAMLTLLSRQHVANFSSTEVLCAALFAVTAGSLLLMWLGELITEKGIGNGVSLLIFAGIIADTPKYIRQLAINYVAVAAC